jgi:hypothetical protein
MKITNSYSIALLALAAESLLAWFGNFKGAATMVAGLRNRIGEG